MANSVYKINKGINKPIEFKGLKAQYIWYLGGGFVVLLILFVAMYLLGVNTYVCLIVIVISGTVLFIRVQRLSHKYGEYGMMKKVALKAIPKVIKCNSRSIKAFRTISKAASN
jgi:Flp pilus assembly protein TadB